MRRLVAVALLVAAPARAEAPADATAEAVRLSLLEEERALLVSEEEKGRVAKNLATLAGQKRDIQQRLDAMYAERATITTRLEALRAQQVMLHAEVERRRAGAAKRMALLSRRSTARPIELLLTATGPGDFVYRYLALQEIVRAERALILEAKQAGDRLIEAQLVLDAELRAAEEHEDEVRTAAARIDALEALEREQFAALQSEADERKLWVAALREQDAALGGMVTRLQEGGKAYPLPKGLNPVAGERVAVFGQSDPFLGGLLPSEGWRFRAHPGTPVVSVAAGKVVYADWFQGYGYLVIIDHGAGYSTLYAHLERPGIERGADVLSGEVVGSAGNSGSTSEPGLYFEVRRDGRPIDPAGWLKKRK